MKLLAIAISALLLGAVATAPTGASAAPPSAQAETRKAKTTIPGSGTFRVRIDFRPGTYVSKSTGSLGGYWERLSCATGDFDCILANDNVTGQSFVTILPTDKFFSTSRMATWRLASKVKPARPAERFAGDGMFRVGIDIQPGTYVSKSTGSLGGYWERLSCATGDFDCILANDNVDGQAIVEIEPTDAYFSTSRMGTWSRG